jgi:nitrogen fixation/metabolism regulation signal transduction histidine kinase
MLRDEDPGSMPMKSLLLRPTRLVAVVFALVLTIALGALSLFTWLDYKRVESIRAHVNRTTLFQESFVILKDLQLQTAEGKVPPNPDQLRKVREDLALIPIKGGPIGSYMTERLQRLNELMTQAETRPQVALPTALALVNESLERESRIQLEQLDTVYGNTRLESHLALGALVAFPTLVLLALWALRERVFRPIAALRVFLSRIANGDFTPVPLGHIDPLLEPLFQNYNQMAERLEQLEQANRQRTLSLEQEVRAAMQTLLQQQQSLARAERLAAAGEVSATLAHELRNPLAGMQVTLANLRRELSDNELEERVDLVISEVNRITRLLNGLLQQTRHVPEPARFVSVDRLMHDLSALIRFQLPPNIELVAEVPRDLRCRLPEDGVRQAVLNLVLNSVAILRDAPGLVTVQVLPHDEVIEIRVLDDGPGFPDSVLTGGIRPFVTSRESGTGLGLAIVKRFARDMGGELTIANRTPRGACVTLTLPTAREDVRHAVAD